MSTLENIIFNGFIKPVAVINAGKKFITANKRMRQILDLPADYTEHYLFEMIEDENLVLKFTEPGYLAGEEVSISGKEKYILHVETCLIPGEESPGRVIVLDDISDLKKRENIILGKLDIMICRILQSLTEAVGYFEISSHKNRSPDGFRGEINTAFTELTRLLDQMQCYICFIKGNFHLNRILIPPETVLNDFLKTVTVREGVRFKKNIEKIDAKIDVDVSKLCQVLYIVLDNAIRFTPAGGTVTVSLVDKHGHVEFSVRDDGPGMDDDRLRQVFDDVLHESDTGGEDVGHPGIGIPLAHRIISEHGGTFWIDTQPGKGTDVHIALISR